EALTVGGHAAVIDPLVSGDVTLPALFGLGRYDELLRVARAGLAIDSLNTGNDFRGFMAPVLIDRGQADEGLELMRQSRIVHGIDTATMGMAYARAHHVEEARIALRNMLRTCG